ncbi:MAG: hypothetical protein AAGA54_31445 [Myxococcota bacterium]
MCACVFGCSGTETAPEVPEEALAFNERHQELVRQYCPIRYPTPGVERDLCDDVPGPFLASLFPSGAFGCYLLVVRDAPEFLPDFLEVAACLGPLYESAAACLSAAASPDEADTCKDSFNADAAACRDLDALSALRAELNKCGPCDLTNTMAPEPQEPLEYCVETLNLE